MTDSSSTSTLVPLAAPAPALAVRQRSGSLRRRLPLVISLFLLAIVGAGGAASYIEVRQAVLDAARGRLVTNARQWSLALASGLAQRVDEARKAAASPALQQRLVADDPATVAAAQHQLETVLATAPQNIAIELWTASGERLAQVVTSGNNDGPDVAPGTTFPPPLGAGSSPLLAQGDLLYTEQVAEVRAPAAGPDPSRRGWLVFRRRAASPAAGQSIGRLIGAGNAVRLGSRKSGLWTDFSRAVEAPPTAAPGEVVTFERPGGSKWLGTEVRVANTPLAIWAETPEAVALGPARTFWNAMLPLGTLFVVLGGLLTWIISRRITTPIADLTSAAEALAGGDLSRRVRSARTDEVGRLADAFNTMADQVQAGYSRLDTGIKERTAELETAMTQLHATQEQLVRREKLAMLGQLASGVGHELRNPLGVMTNAVYYLEMIQPGAPADVQEYLGILRAQIGLAEKIVGDLLDFSRIRPPRRDVVDLADVVAAQEARLGLPEGISLRIELPGNLPRVSVDGIQIGQILFNLLINAVQALEGRTGTVRVGASASDTHVEIHVEDDGSGVPENVRTRIFEPLFTTKARGIGLGLAVSRSLAEANGGTLTLEPSERGARFTLTLPRQGAGDAA